MKGAKVNGAFEGDDTLKHAVAQHAEVRRQLEEKLADLSNGDSTPIDTPSGLLIQAVERLLGVHDDNCDACRRVRDLLGT